MRTSRFALPAVAPCIAALLLLAFAPPLAGDDSATWESDPARAFERARAEKKPLLIDLYASWSDASKQMNARTLRDRGVLERLANFVLLRVNVDSSDLDEKYQVRSFPTYLVRDPLDRGIYTFYGFSDARTFTARLDSLLKTMPEMLTASEELSREASAAGFMKLGSAYDRATAYPQARAAYLKASELAGKANEPQLAQIALVEAAIVRIKADQIGDGVADLRALAASPHDADVEAAIWLGIGFGEEARKDFASAKEAYEKAASVAPAGTPLRAQIDRKLQRLSERRR